MEYTTLQCFKMLQLGFGIRLSLFNTLERTVKNFNYPLLVCE